MAVMPETDFADLRYPHSFCAAGGLKYTGDLQTNYRLPTALGALIPAALAPESFAGSVLRRLPHPLQAPQLAHPPPIGVPGSPPAFRA